MIGVMFKWKDSITTDTGKPVVKVYMYDENSNIHGIKHHGFRPIEAYVFEVVGSKIKTVDEDMLNWLHQSISYGLHAMDGKIVYQNEKLQSLFTGKL